MAAPLFFSKLAFKYGVGNYSCTEKQSRAEAALERNQLFLCAHLNFELIRGLSRAFFGPVNI